MLLLLRPVSADVVVEERRICCVLDIRTNPPNDNDSGSHCAARSAVFSGSQLLPLFAIPNAGQGVPFEFNVEVYATEELKLAEVRLLDRGLNPPCGTISSSRGTTGLV